MSVFQNFTDFYLLRHVDLLEVLLFCRYFWFHHYISNCNSEVFVDFMLSILGKHLPHCGQNVCSVKGFLYLKKILLARDPELTALKL